MTDHLPFPNRAAHTRAWEDLARAIAAAGDTITEEPSATPPANSGELTVIGSGIETVGFTLGDEALIRNADAVLYCVADPSTVVWLKSIRPDAYDLYVLYDDDKVRYTTYMQMTEAMLHFVRQGKRVVAVYYGHPGIFVLSTHRAIMIARREGHRAVMRPGVCALDCLCADLGVDPCHPGMQTHEATDMLIRSRVPDTSLHVVLWQVGLIGEMGFRRKGYINENFSVFIEYLQKYYGDDYPVTHYVASRYPSIDPLIEVHPLHALHDPRIQGRVTGVSTFYIAPKDNIDADRDMLMRLGLLKPGQSLRTTEGPLREIGKYSARERKAFTAFRRFKVPKGYHWQEDTGASRFLIGLREDLKLRQLYQDQPREAVASFPGLSERERKMLRTRDPGAIQIAAKGGGVASEENRALLMALFQQKPLQLDLLKCLRGAPNGDPVAALDDWSQTGGHPADWDRMRTDIDLLTRHFLFAWAGIYRTESDSPADERLITLTGGGGGTVRLSVDGEPVSQTIFRQGTLQWQAGNGRAENGFLRVDVDGRGRRRLIGTIWPQGQPVPAEHRLVAVEVPPGRQHPASLTGRHVRTADGRIDRLDITVVDQDGSRRLQATLNGDGLEGPITLAGRELSIGDQRFMLEGSGSDATGPVWRRESDMPSTLFGTYTVKTVGGRGLRTFAIGPGGVSVNGTVPATVEVSNGKVRWQGGPAAAASGRVTLVLDPITLFPVVFGTVETPSGAEARCNGLVPPPPDLTRPEPEFGLPPVLWQRLVALAARPDRAGGLLLWHQAEKANLAATIIHTMLAQRLP